MGVYSISSRSLDKFKSVSLGTNEEFVRLYNDVTEARRLKIQSSRVLDNKIEDLGFSELSDTLFHDVSDWRIFQDGLWEVDKLMKRAEKNAKFSLVLASILLEFEQKIFPLLRDIPFHVDDFCWDYEMLSTILMTDQKFLLIDLLKVFPEFVSSWLELAHKVVVSALALLSFVYHYLIGCVDKGGSKTYSPGSFLFRLIFVAIVLFLGSYVWIKFRQISYIANRRKRKSCELANRASQMGDESDVPEGVYRRAVKNTSGRVTHYKYEPKFKPRREKLESGTSLEFSYLPLGSYDTSREAEIVRCIAAILYGREGGCPVQFEDRLCLFFPSVSEQENCPPSGKEKAVWMAHKTKELYAKLLTEKARREERLHPALHETGSDYDHGGEASRSGPSPSAPVAPSTAIELTHFTSHGGNGVVEQSTTSEFRSLGQEPPLTGEVFAAFYPEVDFQQFMESLPQWEENDLPALDGVDKFAGDDSETDHVFGCESTLVPPQLCALDIPTTAIVASLPHLGRGDQGLEIIEPQLNSATAITFQQSGSLLEQVQHQLCATGQWMRLEEYAGTNAELQQKLYESEVLNSELQQKLRKSEGENEKWRSMWRQLSKFISASNVDGNPVDIQ